MSSRILGPTEKERAAPLDWKAVPRTGTPAASAAASKAAGPPPSIEQYRALEARLLELEAELPGREQQARLAGMRDAEAAVAARWEAWLEKAARALTELAALRGRLRREAEADVVRLSLAIARRVLRRELSIDPEAVLALLRTALEKLDLRETHRVRVRPEDVPILAAHLERIGSPHRVEVVPDPTLERGGLVLETQRGNLDASVETQLQEIERGFSDLLRKRSDA